MSPRLFFARCSRMKLVSSRVTIMVATASRVCSVGAFLLAGLFGMGIGGERAATAFDDPNALQPIPSNETYSSDSANRFGAPQPESTYESGECDFCGLPLCSPPGQIWLRSDYLVWWTNGRSLPPLVTTSPLGTARTDAGVLGKSGTTIMYGNETVGDGGRSGFRNVLGLWLDPCHAWGVEFDYLNLGGQTSRYNSVFSTGDPILARPFFDVQKNAQASELTAYDKVVEGDVSVLSKDYFQSGGVDLTYNLCTCDSCSQSCDPCLGGCDVPRLFCCRTDLIAGFRFYNFDDSIVINEYVRLLEAPYAGNRMDIQDSFRARNEFYGSELGLRTQVYRGRWTLEILTKVALGNTHQVVNIAGHTVVTPTIGPTETYDAGVLAVGTNSGTYTRDVFTMIPQLGLELGYQVNCNWRTFVGYILLYWGFVVRAADLIDLNLDPRNFPPVEEKGLPFPAFSGRTSSFWAHGINVGLECRF